MSSPTSADHPSTSDIATDTLPLKVLVIDDDPIFLRTLGECLHRCGCVAIQLANATEAEAKCREAKPDVLVTDVIMPERDGLELIRVMRREFPALRIIAISGGGRLGASDYLTLAKKLGAHATLSKPFEAQQLIALLRPAAS